MVVGRWLSVVGWWFSVFGFRLLVVGFRSDYSADNESFYPIKPHILNTLHHNYPPQYIINKIKTEQR